MGEVHHIGFTVASRFSWGMRGSYCKINLPMRYFLLKAPIVPVIIRAFVACMWFGMQSYWYLHRSIHSRYELICWKGRSSNQSPLWCNHTGYVSCELDSLPHSAANPLIGFAHMPNYFPESSHLLTKDFIGMIIWYAAFIPLVLIPPERLQLPFAISFFMFAGSCIGILVW
jgi:NCS1 family nucleobase:cation symporter-1